MKGRYLLVLAVITAAVVLGLPGIALAAYETPTEVHFAVTTSNVYGQWWDLDSGTIVPSTAASSSEIQLIAFDSDGHDWYVGVCENGGQCYQFIDRETYETTRSFDSIVYADLADLAWLDSDYNCIAPFVVRTVEGNAFKVQLVQAGVENAQDWVYRVQRLQPDDPLAEHVTFSFAPEGQSYAFDLDEGTIGTTGADLDICYTDIGNTWVEMAFMVVPIPGAAGIAGYDYAAADSCSDIVGVHFGTYSCYEFPASFLVRTDEADCYRVRVSTNATDLTLTVEYRLLPADASWKLLYSTAVGLYAYYADFDAGTGAESQSAGSDLKVGVDGTYPFIVCLPGASYTTALPTSYLSMTWEDLVGLSWTTSQTFFPNPWTTLDVVVKTAAGRYFAVNFGEHENGNTIWYRELLPPDAPPQLLTNLGDFVVEPTVGAVATAMEDPLLAKVDAAQAALAKDNKNAAKVAMNDLKALVNQTQAQTDKKISAAAAAKIIDNANTIISALGQ